MTPSQQKNNLIYQLIKKNTEDYVTYAMLTLLSHVLYLKDEGERNLTKKSEAEVAPPLLIWSSPLRTLPRMYADSTLCWAECAFSLLEKEHWAVQNKSLLFPPMFNQITLQALKVIHKKKKKKR